MLRAVATQQLGNLWRRAVDYRVIVNVGDNMSSYTIYIETKGRRHELLLWRVVSGC